MVKKVISIATTFLMLFCMIPFAAFAETVVCPKCGESTLTTNQDISVSVGEQIGLPLSLKRAYCSNCHYAKYEYNILGIAGEQTYDDGDELHIINFLKSLKSELLGKNATTTKVPTGIGRKDLPGYADDNGTATYNSNGELQVTVYPRLRFTSSADFQNYPASIRINYSYSVWTIDGLKVTGRSTYSGAIDFCNVDFYYFLSAPVSGTYYIATQQEYIKNQYTSSGKFLNQSLLAGSNSFYLRKGATQSFNDSSVHFYCNRMGLANSTVTSYFCPIILTVIPDTTTINQQTNITINNNTWNGNIYTDNSTNLTYIYPQYTTINEKNETVTNISNNPIIYNNETKQYYTYDTVTNNYYYITYEAPATPTPSPSPEPSPTPDPGASPTPTPKPGGSISTPETGKPGGSSGSSQSWWDKLLSKIGDAIIDGLLGAISAVLKLIFKLFSTILGWIIWLTSQVLTLFPFLPPGLGALLIGGVVVCFVIGIIKFIRG